MYAYFHKDKFLRFILNDDDASKERLIRALGHNPKDVEIIKYNVALRNDSCFYFDENKDIVMLDPQDQEVVEEIENEETKEKELVTSQKQVFIKNRTVEKDDRERFEIKKSK